MSSLIDDAAGMPLPDAAFLLWRSRVQLDIQERAGGRKRRIRRLKPGSHAFSTSIRQAVQAGRDAIAHADDGPTFDRLKVAFPQTRDADLKAAIRAAAKLQIDACRNAGDDGGGVDIENLKVAIGRARAANPDFSEATYAALLNHVAYLLK